MGRAILPLAGRLPITARIIREIPMEIRIPVRTLICIRIRIPIRIQMHIRIRMPIRIQILIRIPAGTGTLFPMGTAISR